MSSLQQLQHHDTGNSTAPEDGHSKWWDGIEPMRLHASLMIFAWFTLVHLGTLCARYLRDKPYWFYKLHLPLQAAGAIVSLGSFFLIVVHVDWSSSTHPAKHFTSVHHVGGLVVTCLLVLQVTAGLVSHLTWFPGKPISAIDRWHRFIGKFTMFSAWATILTGFMQLSKEGYTNGPGLNAMLGFFFFLVFIVIGALESHCFADKSIKEHGMIQDEDVIPLIDGAKKSRRGVKSLFIYSILVVLMTGSMVIGLYFNLTAKVKA